MAMHAWPMEPTPHLAASPACSSASPCSMSAWDCATAHARELCCCTGGARQVRDRQRMTVWRESLAAPLSTILKEVWPEKRDPPICAIPDGGLHILARRVEGTFRKSPLSGKSMVKRWKERYFALCPLQSEGGDAAAGQPQQDVQRWAQGRLCVWKDKAAYRAQEPPRTSIELLKIAKVSWDRKCPAGSRVMVRHLAPDGKLHELFIQFRTKGEATNWAYALWDFITQVRSILDEGNSS